MHIVFDSFNIITICNMMHPRLYMQSFQFATYNTTSDKVTFETRHISGRRFHFVLTKNQLLALDDSILLIDRGEAWGHFPLGNNAWFHYDNSAACLYKEHENGRAYFHFSSFREYKTVTHHRLLSLIRLKEQTPVARRERRSHNARRHIGTRGRGESENKSTCNKRALSSVLKPSDRPSTSKRNRGGEREAASRPSNDVVMSHDDEKSSIFSKWKSSSPRRRSDSISSLSSVSKSVLSPEEVQLESANTLDSMESE